MPSLIVAKNPDSLGGWYDVTTQGDLIEPLTNRLYIYVGRNERNHYVWRETNRFDHYPTYQTPLHAPAACCA